MEQYAIVRFKEQEENSKILDLVPISWVRGDENSRYTLYPEPCDYQHIEKWLSCSKEPEENWKSFAIEVIAYAGNLKQEKRRLKRALKTENFTFTDDGCNEEFQPITMSIDSVSKRLNAVRSFQHHDKCSSPSVNSMTTVGPKTKNNSQMCLGNEERNLEIADIPLLEETAAIEILNLSPNNDPVTKEYINHKFNELQEAISNQIASAKRSILYELEKKINGIKHTLLFNSATGSSTLQDSIIQNFNSWRYNRKRQYR
ncbi:uncharacterized protein LOC114882146 [Osmia bicornis bicornis]|uniref:uncharacterized protein LOC114882146 n=1 Tax=Osmia bicornis bicornis TaxID=1437191 RepID=UPI001EAEF0FB|nr:uncharacterized protein LOC114882146 [Osmia bicornis bicornis]